VICVYTVIMYFCLPYYSFVCFFFIEIILSFFFQMLSGHQFLYVKWTTCQFRSGCFLFFFLSPYLLYYRRQVMRRGGRSHQFPSSFPSSSLHSSLVVITLACGRRRTWFFCKSERREWHFFPVVSFLSLFSSFLKQ